jgi:FtsP/CotA-like multicopper oxidase with cupredoxin domain
MTVARSLARILAAVSCAVAAGCAAFGPQHPDDIPAALRVAGTQTLTQRLHATGVQIYRCEPAKCDPAQFQWSFKQPEATLATKAGGNIGKHYAGPTWEANDGSKVTGEVIARADSPAPNAIPWLLLSAKTTSGTGIFSAVESIQRLHTEGGAAPAGGCSPAQAGQELRVAYSADYLFYAAKH